MLNRGPEQQQPAAEAAPATPQRTQPFTDDQLLQAWKDYMTQHPQEKALLTTMNYAKPQRKDGDTHLVLQVSSPGEVKNLDGHKEALLQFLHDALSNDQVTLDVEVSEAVVPPKVLTPREIVENIKSHNPGFNDFLRDFDLSLY